MSVVKVKYGNSLAAGEKRAQALANRTGKRVEIHYQRLSTEGDTSRRRYYWAYYDAASPQKGNMATKRKKKARRKVSRVPAAVTRFLKRLNPSKMKGVKNVRIKKLKGGGVSITPMKAK